MDKRPAASEAHDDGSDIDIYHSGRSAERQQILSEATDRAREGRFLDALQTLRRAGSLRDWSGADRCEVAWIVRELGAPRLATWHVLKSYRETPDALSTRNGYASEILADRGPLETLEFLESRPEPSTDDPTVERLHWMWLHSACYMTLRDFPAATRWVKEMDAIGERADVVWFVRANLLERQDRYDEAFEAIDRSIRLRDRRESKDERRAIQYKAHLLTLRGRDDEAYALLEDADSRMQVGGFAWQMATIAYERRDYQACQRLLERFESLTPLRERAFGDMFLLFRSEVARRLGNDEEAIRYAGRSRSSRGREIAAMLADPSRLGRTDKILPVPFIRQHEMTCGPATLAAISAYWGRPAEHLEVAEEICYAGTTTHAERKWAEENGFATAEFTVTETATEALIARDVPFTLVTRGAGYAHLQAVIGYDGRTATALIRDPYHRTRGAAGISELLKDQAAHGPRGMVMVPREQVDRLTGLQLPEAALHDFLHRFDDALINHRRDDAVAILHELSDEAPGHRITLLARRQLALYDANELGMLAPVEELLEQYPDDASLQLSQVSLLGAVGRHQERLQRLRELAERPQAHPLLMLQLGEALAQDGRTRDEAERLVREAIRRGPTVSRAYLELGDLWFVRGRRREALRLYRFAAALEDTDEFAAMRYFDAAVVTGHSDEVMRWLRGRFKRFGGKSLQPAVTLTTALLRQRKHHEALDVLTQSLQRRPEDAELKLFVAQTVADMSSEQWPFAEQLLEEARSAAPQRQWRLAASHLCVLKGELTAARDHLTALLPLSPMSMSLHESISDLTSQLDGEDTAIEHWRDAAAKFPHCQPLQERYAIALRDRPLEIVRQVLDEIIEQNPDNAWAHRELAQHLLTAGRLEEAEAEISRSQQLDEDHVFCTLLQSTLAHRRGHTDDAKQLLRDLIARDVNEESAVGQLISFCQNADQVRDELQWLAGQMREATITGDVLLMYRDFAETVLPAEGVLANLHDALAARTDLWPAHQAVIRQLVHMQRMAEATAAADQATRQFPLEPAAWFERYQVAVAAADHQSQRSTLNRVRLLRPGNPVVLRALAELDASLGDHESSRQLLEELVAKQPLDPVNRGYLGNALLELDEPEAALVQFEHAVRLSPDYDFAWNMIDRLGQQLGKTDCLETIARDLTQTRPHETAAWLQLAYVLAEREEYEQAHECLDRAERIDPYREAIHIARSRFLVHAGDFDAALAALSPAVYADVPVALILQRCQLMWDLVQQDAAFEMICRAAEENPTLVPAWQRLQQWATIRGDRDRAISAIEHQVAANPHDPDVLDAAGGALADLQENERAIEMLRRAIDIAPAYTGSRCRLFDLLTEHGDWEEADRLVTNLPRLGDHPAVIARRLQVAEHRGDIEAQNVAMDAILQSHPINGWAIDQATEAMVRQRRTGEFTGRIEQALQATIDRVQKTTEAASEFDGSDADRAGTTGTGDDAPGMETDPSADEPTREGTTLDELAASLGQLGRKWAEMKLKHGDGSKATVGQVVDQIRNWMMHPVDVAREPGRTALTVLVEHLTSQPTAAAFNRFFKRNQSWLREDTSCWGTIAYAFAVAPTRFGKSQMRKWVADYQQRAPMPAWVYTNVHEILRLTGQSTAAVEAVQAALRMPPDSMRSQLALWASHDCLVAGDDRRALHHFMQAQRIEDLEGTDRLMHVWVESVLMLGQAPDRQAAFAEVRRQIEAMQMPASFFQAQPVYRPVYVNTLRLIAQLVGTSSARWWARGKRLKLFFWS